MRERLWRATAQCLTYGIVICVPSVALAQGAPEPTRGAVLEELIVTARKQVENLQKAPVAVTALSAQSLEQRNITDTRSLNATVPNLHFQRTANTVSGAIVAIRGIGANISSRPIIESGVSMYINGLLLPASTQNFMELVDIERIEVLRGPQGTLFGRNTIGGAISLFTPEPTDDFHFQQKVGYGTYNDFTARSVVNTGLIGHTKLKARISYLHHQIDGYQHVPGRRGKDDPGASRSDSMFGTLSGQLSDNYSFDLYGDYAHSLSVPLATQLSFANPNIVTYLSNSAALGGRPFSLYPTKFVKDVYATGDLPAAPTTIFGAGLVQDWDLTDRLALKSLSSFRHGTTFNHGDLSGGLGGIRGNVTNALTGVTSVQQVPFFRTNFVDPLFQSPYPGHPYNGTAVDWGATQELQALWSSDAVKAVTGLYYLLEKTYYDQPAGSTTVAANGLSATYTDRLQTFRQKSTSYAAFGQASWRPRFLDRRLELTGGVRYTFDRRTVDERNEVARVPTFTRHLVTNWDYISYTASASFQWTPDIMTYFRAGNANKAGGFNPGDLLTTAYNPEKVDVLEVGVRSELFQHRLRFNGTLFRSKFNQQQLTTATFNPVTLVPQTTIVNAGVSRYQGAEAEFTAIVTDSFVVDGSVGFLDAKFLDYPRLGVNLADGAKVPQAPKWTIHGGAQYEFKPTAWGVPSFRVDFTFRTPVNVSALTLTNPFARVLAGPESRLLDARFTLSEIPLGHRGATGKIQVYGRNLLNLHESYGHVDFGTWGVQYWGPGRTFGGMFTADF